ncbi:MAG TPA: Ig-like domain-containing protein [Longimicrobium sp.]|nr:Ig-like domain-containing protein [Longimicrobium sp.]
MRRPRLHLLAPAAVLLAGACADLPTGVEVPDTRPGALTFAYHCSADVHAGWVDCDEPVPLPGGVAADLRLGGAHVSLTGSNASYNSTTEEYTIDMTLTNNIGQAIGTTDGYSADANGIRPFFHSGPTVTAGSGTVQVVPDGVGTFTSANQPYYQYNDVVEPGNPSSAKTWTFLVPTTVQSFSFTIFVSAPVQYPAGWITVTLDPDTIPGGGNQAIATAVVKSAVGAVITTGTVYWSSDDPAVATVSDIDPRNAEVYGYDPGSATITASHDDVRFGSAVLEVN